MHVPRIPAPPARSDRHAATPGDAPPPGASGATPHSSPRTSGSGAAVLLVDIAPASAIAAPAPPMTAADLEGIVVSSAVDFASGAERLDSTLLMKDGRARLALEGSPLDLRPPPDGAAPDGLWTRWRPALAGDGYEVLDTVTDLWTALAGRLFAPKSEPQPTVLSGAHRRTRTTVLGATTSTVTERLELALDGTFSRARSVLATTVRPGSDGGVPSIVHVPETATDPARLGGDWTLLEDGFTLELVHADGHRERSLFLDDGGSRMIGGRRFSFAAERIETIDPAALAARWRVIESRANDWRSVFAEALSRGVEQRAVRPREGTIAVAPSSSMEKSARTDIERAATRRPQGSPR